MKIKSTNIGSILKQARCDARITRDRLSADMGISVYILGKVEQGVRSFDTDWMIRMPAPMRGIIVEALLREVNAILI